MVGMCNKITYIDVSDGERVNISVSGFIWLEEEIN